MGESANTAHIRAFRRAKIDLTSTSPEVMNVPPRLGRASGCGGEAYDSE